MDLIKVDAINSTNSLARAWWKEDQHRPMTCIWAREQLEGRGQRGTQWNTQPGQNLTFSVLLPSPKVSLSRHFILSASVALSLAQVLHTLEIPKISVKWPNDIMSANKKVGGILIETLIAHGKLSAAIVGVGLNVNQLDFGDLVQAGSLKMVSGRSFDLQDLLNLLLKQLETDLQKLNDKHSEEIMKLYKSRLFRMGVPSTFELPDKQLFSGMIKDVGLDGRLVVQTEDDRTQCFDIKEVRLRF